MIKRAIAIAALVLITLAGVFAYSKSRRYQLFGTIVPRVETQRKIVALTFDDGPSGVQELAEIEAALGETKATFFVCGAEMKEHPDITPRLVAAGHEIGNHTWHHDRMWFKSPSYIRSEIESTDALIRQAGWRGPIHFRAPYCKKLVGLPWYLWRHNRIHVTFDVEPESDPANEGNTDRMVADVLANTRPGSIILVHPWYPYRKASRHAIRLIVASLRARGYEFVTVSELLRSTRSPVAGRRSPVAGKGIGAPPSNNQ